MRTRIGRRPIIYTAGLERGLVVDDPPCAAPQYGRGPDGSTYLWRTRRRDTGRGEGSSGLRFDVLERR